MSEAPDDEVLTEDDPASEEVDARRYASLDVALTDKGIPLENHALIRQFASSIGIAAFYERSTYIKAVRAGDGPDLNIAFGWSNGFASEAEVEEAAGQTADRWPSGRGQGRWGVTHPVHGAWGGGGKKTGNPRLDYGTCPKCKQYALLPTGGCSGSCDD
jgi:hypothetical protein